MGIEDQGQDQTTEQTAEETVVEEQTTEGTESTDNQTEGSEDDSQSTTETPSEPVAYQPNTKFKVMEQEKDFDDFIIPTLKDEDTEKKVRDLYERAYGIDHVKADRQTLRDENKQLKEENQKQAGMLQYNGMVNQFIESGDYDNVFASLGINPQQILQWSLAKAQRSPEQLRQDQVDSNNRLQNMQMMQNMQNQQQNYASQLVSARERELDLVLSQPNVSPVVQAYDTSRGKIGAFREECINRGKYHATVNNFDAPASQVVTEMLGMLNWQQPNQQSVPSTQQVPNTPMIQNQQQNVIQTPSKKPVIKNIASKGSSPVAKIPKSLDDLKKIRDKKLAEYNVR